MTREHYRGEYLTNVKRILVEAREQEDVIRALAGVGYDDAALEEGLELCEHAWKRYRSEFDEYDEHLAARQAFHAAWDTADEVYARHRGFALIAFKEDLEALRDLDLNARRPRAFDRWKEQAERFYTGLLGDPGRCAKLERFRIPEVKLESAETLIEQVATLRNQLEREFAEAWEASNACDEAIDALDDWFSDFREVTRIALEDQPEALAALRLDEIPYET